MGNKGYNPRNDPGNYHQGAYRPSGDIYSSWLGQQAAQERANRSRFQKTRNTMGPFQQQFSKLESQYRLDKGLERHHAQRQHQLDMLTGMQSLGYMPNQRSAIPQGFAPGSQLQQMMGGGGQPSVPSLMNFFAALQNRRGGGGGGYSPMFPGFGFPGQQQYQ